MGIHIIYEDKQLLVCQKEAGIAVQSARIAAKDMVSILKNYLNGQDKRNTAPYIGLVHRLDQPVSGVMVFAKTKKTAAELSRQLQDGGMEKRYQAVVCGKLPYQKGELVDYLIQDRKKNASKAVKKEMKGSKEARLFYEVKEETENESLVEIDLRTGRHHQIRVQLANAGCPICGDRKYNENQQDTWGQIALCAYQLSFVHPVSTEKMCFTCIPKGGAFDKFR